MALAASRTTRLGVIEWNPSGIGFLAGAMITSPFYEFLGHEQFTLLPGSTCERTVKNRRHRRDRTSSPSSGKQNNSHHGGAETRRKTKSNHKGHEGTQRNCSIQHSAVSIQPLVRVFRSRATCPGEAVDHGDHVRLRRFCLTR